MLKNSLICMLVATVFSSSIYANDSLTNPEEKNQDFVYENLKLGKVKHIKVIGDYNNAVKAGGVENDTNFFKEMYSTINGYKEVLQRSEKQDTIALENLKKLEGDLKRIDMNNKLYSENKKVIFVDTDIEAFRSECYFKKYSTLKVCFEYGFGHVLNISKTERKDNNKIAEKEQLEIIDQIKTSGFEKDGDYFIKDNKKFKINVEDNMITTYTTTKELENFRKEKNKALKEQQFNNAVKEHLEFLD